MGFKWKDVAPAVKKETRNVALYTIVGAVLLVAGFGIGHYISPSSVPFDGTVVFGAVAGSFVAVLNFFLMGLTVQKVTQMEDETAARAQMRLSYTYRLFMQMAWVIAAIAAPCFHFVAGIAPLFFPSLGIKLFGRRQQG